MVVKEHGRLLVIAEVGEVHRLRGRIFLERASVSEHLVERGIHFGVDRGIDSLLERNAVCPSDGVSSAHDSCT